MDLAFFNKLQEDRKKLIKSATLCALVFGISGIIQGYFLFYSYEIYGIELRYPGFLALGIIAGILLGVLSKDFKKTIILSLLGFLGAFAPLIFYILLPVYLYFGILEGLFFIFIIAPVFLIFGFYYLIKKRKLPSATCLFFFLFGIIDPLAVYPSAVIGLVIGALFGLGVKKIKTMAYFGMIGFSLASLSFNYGYLIAYVSAVGFILSVGFGCAILGAFLVAGLFYNFKDGKFHPDIDGHGTSR